MRRRILSAVLAAILAVTSAGAGVKAAEINDNQEIIEEVSEAEEAILDKEVDIYEVEEKVSAGSVTINSTNFPDDTFRNYVSNNYDTSKNGVLESSEIEAVTAITFNSGSGLTGVTKIDGIQYLTSLNTANFYSLTNNVDLTKLPSSIVTLKIEKCNKITTINLSGRTSLKVLTIDNCAALKTINLSGCTSLGSTSTSSKKVDIYTNNYLTSIDYTGCSSIKYLNNKGNVRLASVNLAPITGLLYYECNSAGLTSLDVSKNTSLKTLICGGSTNKFTSLDLSKNTSLTSLDITSQSNLTKLDMNYSTSTKCSVIGATAIKDLTLRLTTKATGTLSLSAFSSGTSVEPILGAISDSGYNSSTKVLTFNPAANTYNASLGYVYTVGTNNGASYKIAYSSYDGGAALATAKSSSVSVTKNGFNSSSNAFEFTAYHSASASDGKSSLDYAWFIEKDGVTSQIKNWTTGDSSVSINADMGIYGEVKLIGKVRVSNNTSSVAESSVNVEIHPYLKGTCQMPYSGGGFLIGLEKYPNTPKAVKCKMLVLNCTYLAAGLDPWVYQTEYCGFSNNGMWTIWAPEYGYFWTLFRIYDENNNIIDEKCYGFVNT